MSDTIALGVAKKLTAKGGCVYQPVPIELEGTVIGPGPGPDEPRPTNKEVFGRYL